MRWGIGQRSGPTGVPEITDNGEGSYEVHEWDYARFAIADGSVIVASAPTIDAATRWADGRLKESSTRRSLAIYELRATVTPAVVQTVVRSVPSA